jgi:hypothetical protein
MILFNLIISTVLVFIGVLYDFLVTRDVFNGLMMVVRANKTGNHFNNIVV